MKNTPANQHLLPIQNNADDEIDLHEVTSALFRRWPLIVGGGALGLFLSCLHLLNTKPIYQGEFQIVLGQENSQSGAAAILSKNPSLAAFAGLSGSRGNDS